MAYRYGSMATPSCRLDFTVSQEPYSVRGALRFIRETWQQQGLRALWRGNSATMLRVVPFAAIQFVAHEQFKMFLRPPSGSAEGKSVEVLYLIVLCADLQTCHQLIYFFTFVSVTRSAHVSVSCRKLTAGQRFMAGSLAGCTATVFTYPLDLVRARMAVTARDK